MSERHFRKWLYFPFKDITQDPTMPGNKDRYEKKYGDRLIVRQKGELASLADVHDDEMLIIAGHGLPNSSRIGITTDPGKKKQFVISSGETVVFTEVSPTQATITANDLADELLVEAKLSQTHKYIKLITCGGAGMVRADDANVTWDEKRQVTAAPIVANSHEHMADCLASVLAKALGQRGYKNVMVKGYPGFVGAMEQQKRVLVEGASPQSQEERQRTDAQRDEVEKKTTVDFAKTWAGDVRPKFGKDYWKGGQVGMVSPPTKFVNDYWFDHNGDLKKQHISLAKPDWRDNFKGYFVGW